MEALKINLGIPSLKNQYVKERYENYLHLLPDSMVVRYNFSSLDMDEEMGLPKEEYHDHLYRVKKGMITGVSLCLNVDDMWKIEVMVNAESNFGFYFGFDEERFAKELYSQIDKWLFND